ncbi:DUF551 domain-containing protein [Klebsiella pneumoniae]|nr:DUF551 domain-containing protein [Klebsiella pneumoniae]
MTSKFSIDNKELLQRISSGEAVVGIDFGNLIVRELAAFRMAAMDREPVAVIDLANLDYLLSGADADVWPPDREEMGDVLLYRHPQPAPVVLAIPDEMTPEQAYEIGDYHGDTVDVFARGANWMRQHIIDSTLASAPQSPGSEPATSPGKWIPVSERMPDENAEQQVLACFKGGDISTLYYFEGRWDDAYGIVPIRQDVTHWMPLPAGPKEVQGE